MRFTVTIALLGTALCGCGDKAGKKSKQESAVDVVNRIDNRYVGEWRGWSKKSEHQAGYEWNFELSSHGQFSMKILNPELNFTETFTGTWIGTDGFITLFPDAPGKHIFPVVDKDLAAKGMGYTAIVQNANDAIEFIFGCCDQYGSDYHVIARKVEKSGAGKSTTKLADKVPAKVEPLPPTSKDAPR